MGNHRVLQLNEGFVTNDRAAEGDEQRAVAAAQLGRGRVDPVNRSPDRPASCVSNGEETSPQRRRALRRHGRGTPLLTVDLRGSKQRGGHRRDSASKRVAHTENVSAAVPVLQQLPHAHRSRESPLGQHVVGQHLEPRARKGVDQLGEVGAEAGVHLAELPSRSCPPAPTSGGVATAALDRHEKVGTNTCRLALQSERIAEPGDERVEPLKHSTAVSWRLCWPLMR
eukprot:CAMPEP_0183362832 /NCGR_PEP_ID=MMETSP0164_2-20130417/71762_1 /TAXON_ID=221442 /ORGANISM="Coccolithus pelagicus ssp braarudi, Strain PLY182g" /LENGTH=225 /DNA_ID=CAMNT_0025537789 /DNA_START=448 /DNA_END=1126 /DNA_ORIENTATION=+